MKPKICIVQSNYYQDVSLNLLKGATYELFKKNIKDVNKNKFTVPGILEIPTVIAKKNELYDAFIVLGCVIKGKTPHFEFISKTVINLITTLSVSYKKPIGNGIITCLNKKQAIERSDPDKKNKGGEAARAALTLLEIFKNESK